MKRYTYKKVTCLKHLRSVKARFHYARGVEHSLFLLLIFSRLKSKPALSGAKKSIKQTKNTPFHARCGNEPLDASGVDMEVVVDSFDANFLIIV